MPAAAAVVTAVAGAYSAYRQGKSADKALSQQEKQYQEAARRAEENFGYWKGLAGPSLEATAREIGEGKPLDYGLLSSEAERQHGIYDRKIDQTYGGNSGLSAALHASGMYGLGINKSAIYGEGLRRLRDERDRFNALGATGMTGTGNNYISSLHQLGGMYGNNASNFQNLAYQGGQGVAKGLGALANYFGQKHYNQSTVQAEAPEAKLDTSGGYGGGGGYGYNTNGTAGEYSWDSPSYGSGEEGGFYGSDNGYGG